MNKKLIINNSLKVLMFLAISLAIAYAFATVFIVIFAFTLPKTDGAYGIKIFATPLIPLIALSIATILGLIFSPVAMLLLWKRNLRHAIPIIAGTGLFTIIAVTPAAGAFGLIFVIIVSLISIFCCCACLPQYPADPIPGYCEKCNYDLRGHAGMKVVDCPECGFTNTIIKSLPKEPLYVPQHPPTNPLPHGPPGKT